MGCGGRVGASGLDVKILYDKGIKLKLSDSEVYYTECSVLVVSNHSCSKLHCQKILI